MNPQDRMDPLDAMDPLDMARNCAKAVERAAILQLQAQTAKVGLAGFQSAQVGGCMALISIAGDLRRIADHLAGSDDQ